MSSGLLIDARLMVSICCLRTPVQNESAHPDMANVRRLGRRDLAVNIEWC
jgi:hypothetical protein